MRQGDAKSELGGPDLGLRSVLFGTLGAPLAWTLHLFLSYFLVALGCTTGWQRGAAAGVIVVTLVLAAGALAAAIVSYRRWRQLGGDQSWDEALSDPRGRGGLLWMLGVFLGGIFTLAIVLAGTASLFVRTCGAGAVP